MLRAIHSRWAVHEDQPKAVHEVVDMRPVYLDIDPTRCIVKTRCGKEFQTLRACVGENVGGYDLCVECGRKRDRFESAAESWRGRDVSTDKEAGTDA